MGYVIKERRFVSVVHKSSDAFIMCQAVEQYTRCNPATSGAGQCVKILEIIQTQKMFLYCVGLLGKSSTYCTKYACGFPRRPPYLKPFLAFIRCNIISCVCISLWKTLSGHLFSCYL